MMNDNRIAAIEDSGRAIYAKDCLDVLKDREALPNASVDLIYLDPPFNSKSQYNLPFKGQYKKDAKPVLAFKDTWTWDEVETEHLARLERGNSNDRLLAEIVTFSKRIFNEKPNSKISTSAYLLNMAVRLKEMRSVLKPTGSIYLHCDDTASHYLKAIMDTIFGQRNFRNELAWKRTSAHNDANRFSRVTDRVLFYAGNGATWNPQYLPLSENYTERDYRHKDDMGRYRVDNLTGPGLSDGESGKPWKGYDPGTGGRCWSVPKTGNYAPWIDANLIPGYMQLAGVHERLDALDAAGLIDWTAKGYPRLKRYLAASKGGAVSDFISDIPNINNRAKDYLGYPTQKPVALLERIIRASSNRGDIVLDPFCGCGTTVHAAEALKRRWIGIDISKFSTGLIRNRIIEHFRIDRGHIPVIGCPLTVHEARALAERDKFEFEKWACGAVGAEGLFHQPGERGADGGVDGIIPFHYSESFWDQKTPEKTFAVVQVKGGKVQPDSVKALSTTVRESGGKAGVMICFDRYMGTVENNREKKRIRHMEGDFNFIQGLSVENLVAGKMPDLPLARYAA